MEKNKFKISYTNPRPMLMTWYCWIKCDKQTLAKIYGRTKDEVILRANATIQGLVATI